MKLTFDEFCEICPQGYLTWSIGQWHDGETFMSGTGYVMYSRLTDEQRSQLEKYSNVKLTICWHKYAKEIIHDLVFIGNTIKKKGEKE